MELRKENEDVQQLSPKVASQMLSNIFSACDYEANTVPLEVLSTYSNYRKERNYFQRGVAIVILLLLMLMPICFITPEVDISETEANTGAPTIHIDCNTFLPVKRIAAMIDNYRVNILETETGDFEIHPDRNGELVLEITLVNRQTTTHHFQVTGVDLEPPKLVSSTLSGDRLTIYFSDDSGELDYPAVYAMNANAQKVLPLGYDPNHMSVTFPYEGEPLNIFVQDKFENVLQLILTVR